MRGGLLRSIGFIILVLGAPAAPAAENPVDFYRKAVAAYKADDYEGYRANMSEAARLAPDHPAYMFNLAGANALTGHPEAAIRALRRLVTIKVWLDLEAEKDFDAIRDLPEFKAIVADLALLKKPVGSSVKAFRLPEKDFIPEGLVWDPATRSFLVGSVHLGRIVRVDRRGKASDFTKPGEAGVWSILGMAADAGNRILWACTSAVGETAGVTAGDKGKAALLRYDLDTGKLLTRYPLAGGQPGHNCNDLAIGPAGDLFVSDALTGAILRLAPGAGGLEEFLPPGTMRSPQGLAFSGDGRYLFAADYSTGLYRFTPPDATPLKLEHPDDMTARGIDGLRFHNGSLIAIQNGIRPHRVVRLRLDEAMERIREAVILEMSNPRFDEPTLGAVVGRMFFYVANSQWGRFEPDGTIFPMDRLERPLVLKLRLE